MTKEGVEVRNLIFTTYPQTGTTFAKFEGQVYGMIFPESSLPHHQPKMYDLFLEWWHGERHGPFERMEDAKRCAEKLFYEDWELGKGGPW